MLSSGNLGKSNGGLTNTDVASSVFSGIERNDGIRYLDTINQQGVRSLNEDLPVLYPDQSLPKLPTKSPHTIRPTIGVDTQSSVARPSFDCSSESTKHDAFPSYLAQLWYPPFFEKPHIPTTYPNHLDFFRCPSRRAD